MTTTIDRRWKAIRDAGFITIEGGKYDLSHLAQKKIEVTIPATAKQQAVDFELLIQYSSHCVSIGPKQNQDFDFDALGHDRMIIDDRNIRRLFDARRHELSFFLPAILEALPDRSCFFTGHENFLTIESSALGLPHSQPYEIYFGVYREGNRFLRLHVESAYLRDAENMERQPRNFKREDKVSGKVLLLKKLRDEPIRRPPNQATAPRRPRRR